jgi:hypothetical protein
VSTAAPRTDRSVSGSEERGTSTAAPRTDKSVSRRVVYTVLVGGYETLLDQHVAGRYDTDLIAFTDDPDAVSSTWQIKLIEPEFPLDGNRSSRRPKILTHDYLADYDESLYVDNTVLLTVDPAMIFDRLLPPDAAMALFRHSFRSDLLAEFETVVKTRRESAWVCDEQREHYAALAPAVLQQAPYWGGFLLRRHNRPEVRAAMTLWWEHVLRYSRRDQLSLPFVTRAHGLEVVVHDLDNHLSEFHEWPRMTKRDPAGGAPLAVGPEKLLQSLEVQVEELNRQITGLGQQLREEREGRQSLKAQIDGSRSALSATQQELAAIRASTSWQVTRPMRAARARLSPLPHRRAAARATPQPPPTRPSDGTR